LEKLVLSQRVYDFLLYIYPILARYPQFEKFALQTQIKNCILDMLRTIIRANKSSVKKKYLYDADVLLAELRTLMRLSYDLRYLSGHTYGVVSGKLTEIGKVLGGLIKTVQK
jgi:four helix bundle protein